LSQFNSYVHNTAVSQLYYQITCDCRIFRMDVIAMSGCCDIWREDLRRVLTISAKH